MNTLQRLLPRPAREEGDARALCTDHDRSAAPPLVCRMASAASSCTAT